MNDPKSEWTAVKDDLVAIIRDLGFPEEFGYEIAKNLGSPKAIRRMTTYLNYERPSNPETIVDEMLAICTEI